MFKAHCLQCLFRLNEEGLRVFFSSVCVRVRETGRKGWFKGKQAYFQHL